MLTSIVVPCFNEQHCCIDTRTRERRDFKIIDETDDYIVSINRRCFSSILPSRTAQQRFGRITGNYLRLKLRAAGKLASSIDWIAKPAALSWLRKQQKRPGIRAVDAIASPEQGVSRDCVGLAGLGNHKRRWATCASRKDRDVQVYLKQMIDPCGAEAVTKISLGKTFPKTNAKR